MAKTIFKSNWKKDLKPAVINSTIRGASAAGTAWLANETIPKVFKIGESDPTKRETYNKYVGAGMFLLGTLGEAAIGDEKTRKVAEGMSAYGFLSMSGNLIMPNRKTELGLSGVGSADSDITDWEVMRTQMGAIDPLSDINNTLDNALARAITGPDDFNDSPERGNFNPTDAVTNSASQNASAAAGAASARANGTANVSGLEDAFNQVD